MVYYRKYRPQTIDELDSKSVRDTLYAVLASKDIAHAFLFTGPKGLGKTSTARIVAKAVNCERLVSKRLASSSDSKDPKLNAKRYTLDAGIDLTLVYEKLRKMDPSATWFLHVSKKMLLNGSVKNPKMRPTRLGLSDIIGVLEKI